MNKIYKNLVNGSILGAVLLLGATACSDDHFDVKDHSGSFGGNATIWESIVANDSILSDARAILERAHVMADDKDKKATLTYAQWLNQPMEITVWLPKNGSFDNDYYISLLDRADALRQSDSLSQALKVEYQVVTQFVRNHMALFNNVGSIPADKKIRLLNSKLCTFDPSKEEFNGISYDSKLTTYNGNGVLYVLTEGASPFSYNIFDFMSSDAQFSTVYDVISDPEIDKNVFWPEASTEGAMNEKGEIVYVDSVYRNSNELLSRANALIKNEDSLYVAFIPTNDAWDATMEVVKPLFAYGDKYHYEWDESKFLQTGSHALKFNADSLQEASARSQIIESMFFNVTDFHLADKNDEAAIINHLMYADSLISTNGVVYYNRNKGGVNPMFEGLEPVKASNGYVIAPKDCRIVPEYSFIRRTETRPSSMTAHIMGDHQNLSLTVDNWQKDSVVGEVQDDWYCYYKMIGNSGLKVKLRLQNLASGHYKISAQMLPNRINLNNVSYEDDGITPIKQEPQFDAYIYGDESLSKKLASAKNLTVNQDSVQNVVLFDDFELKKSYKKLPAGYETFAILELSISSIQKRKGKCDALSIGKIVIEPVRK